MAEEHEDYAIESADAGASATIPMEAGQIKKGGYVTLLLLTCMHRLDFFLLLTFWDVLEICRVYLPFIPSSSSLLQRPYYLEISTYLVR